MVGKVECGRLLTPSEKHKMMRVGSREGIRWAVLSLPPFLPLPRVTLEECRDLRAVLLGVWRRVLGAVSTSELLESRVRVRSLRRSLGELLMVPTAVKARCVRISPRAGAV